jgi:hypothetical protein
MSSQHEGVEMQDGARVLRYLDSRAVLGADQLDVILAQHSLALNQGRSADALALTARLADAQPGTRAHLRLRVLDALYAGGDSIAAEAAAEELAITQLELGLEVATVGLEKIRRNLRGTKLARAVSELVEAGRDRQDEWGERLPPHKPWIKPAAIAAAAAAGALIGLLLFFF